MWLLNLFKKPQKIQDDYFGELQLITFKDQDKNYFEGKGLFKPTGTEIEYSINGSLPGPGIEQKKFYEKVEASYHKLILSVKPLIEKEFRNWKRDFKIEDFDAEFTLVGLSIPNPRTDAFGWEMSFETRHDEHLVTVKFLDFTPIDLIIDG